MTQDFCKHCGCPKDVCCITRARDSLDDLNWIDILHKAIQNRKTSWNDNPVWEWRNAGDEILFAVKAAFEKHNKISSQWAYLRKKKLERVK